jgi:hypothetical protein
VVIVFNYAIVGLPLVRKASSIESRSKAILVNQAKSGRVFADSEDGYILDVLKREKLSLDRKLMLLNSISATLAILVVSWTSFGLMRNVPKPK